MPCFCFILLIEMSFLPVNQKFRLLLGNTVTQNHSSPSEGKKFILDRLSDPRTQIWVTPISMLPYGVSFRKFSIALQNKESHQSGKIKNTLAGTSERWVQRDGEMAEVS